MIFFLGVCVRRGGGGRVFLASSNIYFCFASQSREISDSIKYLSILPVFEDFFRLKLQLLTCIIMVFLI